MVTKALSQIDNDPSRLKMSYEEFLEWADEDTQVLPGFWLRPDWLWQVKSLSPLTCALEIEGVAAALQQKIDQGGNTETQA